MSVLDSLPLEQHPIGYRPSRPPTAVYPDRTQVADWRRSEFPVTSGASRHVFWINLEGGLFSPAALQELFLPLARDIRSGLHGPVVLIVVSSDEATVDYLDGLAQRHNLSFFLVPSPDAPLEQARPAGALSTTEMQTLDLVKNAGGEVTSSHLASVGGMEVNAAVNRLTKLAGKGYIYRVPRARRDGDVFLDPRVGAERSRSAHLRVQGVPAASAPASPELQLPDDLRRSVRALADAEGSEPGEVLIRAWLEFAARHRSQLDAESEAVGRMMLDGDAEALAAYANQGSRRRAEEAARRASG